MAPGRRRLGLSFARIVLVAAVATAPALALAQTFEAPPATSTGGVRSRAIAIGRDGSVLVVGDRGPIYSQRFPYNATVPDPPIALNVDAFDATRLTGLAGGGYALAWKDDVGDPAFGVTTVFTQRLSSKGALLGVTIPASPGSVAQARPHGLGPRGDGFVVGWEQENLMLLRPFDATGTPSGPLFDDDTDEESAAAETFIAGVPGGFLMVWGNDEETEARLFDDAMHPLTARFTVGTSFKPTGLAVNPSGTLAAVVGIPHQDEPHPALRLRFFHPDGSYVSEDVLLGYALSNILPQVASDGSGNFLVMWGDRLYTRGFDVNGTSLGPVVQLSNPAVYHDLVIGRRDAGFFLVWRVLAPLTDTISAARVTLCAPGSAVCGDGTRVPTCEVCDDGAANSDTMPDACRTTCVLPRCGDGVTDGDEQCDDGNLETCDGCDDSCLLEAGTVCGDGVVAPSGCQEECDDGNAQLGDGCSATCQVERIPGGSGKPATDCFTTWRIDNPSNDPRYDKVGFVSARQECTDNDPACDFDGGVAGACTFHLAVCVNNPVPAACPSSRIRSWAIAKPSEKQALTRPALAAVRSALNGAVLPSVVGSSDVRCSPDADVVLPLRGQPGAYKLAKLTLKTRADVYSDDIDTDSLQLRCIPSP
jgi:cysteine-rich repeat protein